MKKVFGEKYMRLLINFVFVIYFFLVCVYLEKGKINGCFKKVIFFNIVFYLVFCLFSFVQFVDYVYYGYF